ncbi:hypothetical protein EYC84_003439 [Monilinia fructicola]|uniref:Uncharacterized protein n=1 Tax=Monilinia fructicola TaxID=38448 RepID=A0A5M9JWN1_MONFR|nr:hypothetical protein EYC84_003439 [Monilinia fructicola]
MDDSHRRRRQNEPPYPAQDPRYAQDQSQGRGIPMSMSDRYRSAATAASPSMNRGVGPTPPYNAGYYNDPNSTPSFPTGIPSNPLQYPPTYPSDQRQQQSFSDYNTGIMYPNVTQQNPQNNGYDSQQFPRQPAAMQMLPDVAAPYLPNDPSNTPGTQQIRLVELIYALSTSTTKPRRSRYLNFPSIPYKRAGSGRNGRSLLNLQTALKQIFKNIIDLRLAEASSSLLEVSEWLLGHVAELGLTVDEVALHGDRVRLWNEFNAAWLGIFTRQQDFLQSGQRTQPPQTLMSLEAIGKMGTNLTRLCDSVEKYGLVD